MSQGQLEIPHGARVTSIVLWVGGAPGTAYSPCGSSLGTEQSEQYVARGLRPQTTQKLDRNWSQSLI